MSASRAGSVRIDTLRGWRRARLLGADDHQPRARRASDLLVLLASGFALLGFSLAAQPPAGFERALISFIDAVPAALDPLWQLVLDVGIVWTVTVVVIALVRRRWAVVADLVAGAVLAAGVSLLVGHAVLGGWPDAGAWAETRPGSPWYPSIRLTVLVAVLATASPHLTRPARRVGRWLIVPLVLATALVDGATPGSAVAGWLAGLLAAAV